MKYLLIHNSYGKYSGEEAVVDSQVKLLESHGHLVSLYQRSSAELTNMRFGTLRAFLAGIYNPWSCRQVKKLLAEQKPDIVHIHNLYPLISPAVLPVIKKAGVPIVMTVHNYRLVCPNGLFMNKGQICEKCRGGREYNCLWHNCESNFVKSLGYGLRNWFARVNRYYLDNVDCFACLTEFQKQILIAEGFNPAKIVVIPNMADISAAEPEEKQEKGYAFYAGRISHEKGLPILLEAAKALPQIQFKLAGGGNQEYIDSLELPDNVEMLGMLDKASLKKTYDNARLFVLASIWYEGFPMVFPEAMAANLPIIAPNMAGYPEIVEDGKTGLLFEPGNASDLAAKIKQLWSYPDLARQMGHAGRAKALREYSADRYYQRLMEVYEKVTVNGYSKK